MAGRILLGIAGLLAVSGAAAIGILGLAALFAQQRGPATPLAFEVASVKSNAAGEPATFEITPTRLSVHNTDLGHLIMRAYNIAERQFASVGSWLPVLTGRYDIEAKSPTPANRAEMMRMLQALLTERFRLTMHHEPKQV